MMIFLNKVPGFVSVALTGGFVWVPVWIQCEEDADAQSPVRRLKAASQSDPLSCSSAASLPLRGDVTVTRRLVSQQQQVCGFCCRCGDSCKHQEQLGANPPAAVCDLVKAWRGFSGSVLFSVWLPEEGIFVHTDCSTCCSSVFT